MKFFGFEFLKFKYTERTTKFQKLLSNFKTIGRFFSNLNPGGAKAPPAPPKTTALHLNIINFIYSEKATKFCEIFTLLLTVSTVVKSKGKISQNFVAFSEYMNFTTENFRT